MIETLKVRSITQADKNYSVLISLPAPMNFLLLFMAPILLTSKEPAKVNETALKIAYYPILLLATLIFIGIEVITWPFVYVKMFFHKLTMVWVYSKSYRISRADKFINFLVYFVIGPFVIILTTLTDVYHFVRHALKTDLKKTKHKMKHQQLKKENIQLMHAFFNEKKERILAFKDVSSTLREQMGVIESVRDVLFPDVHMMFAGSIIGDSEVK